MNFEMTHLKLLIIFYIKLYTIGIQFWPGNEGRSPIGTRFGYHAFTILL